MVGAGDQFFGRNYPTAEHGGGHLVGIGSRSTFP
jgi:hypothetical protein